MEPSIVYDHTVYLNGSKQDILAFMQRLAMIDGSVDLKNSDPRQIIVIEKIRSTLVYVIDTDNAQSARISVRHLILDGVGFKARLEQPDTFESDIASFERRRERDVMYIGSQRIIELQQRFAQDERSTASTTFEYYLASLRQRMIAFLIDSVILIVYLIACVTVLNALKLGAGWILPLTFLYYWFFWARRNGQTPGKRYMHIRIVREDGGNISAWTVFKRLVGFVFDTYPLILLRFFVNMEKSQMVHDYFAGTLVVSTDKVEDFDELRRQQEADTFPLPLVRPYMTWALILSNVLVYILLVDNQAVGRSYGAINRGLVLDFEEYYRLATAIFLHANFAHLFFNMLALYVTGRIMERTVGHLRLLLVYVLGGLAGSLASISLNDYYVFSIGASGAVFAVFGAEAIYFYRNRRWLGASAYRRFENSFAVMVINLVNGFATPGVDNWAHLGGAIGGALVILLIGPSFAREVDAMDGSKGQVQRDMRGELTGLVAVGCFFIAFYLMLSAVAPAEERIVRAGNAEMTLSQGWNIVEEGDFQQVLGMDCVGFRQECLLGANMWDLSVMVFSQGCLLNCGTITDFGEALMDQWQNLGMRVQDSELLQVESKDAMQVRISTAQEHLISLVVLERPNQALFFFFAGPSSSMNQMSQPIAEMIDSIVFSEAE